MKTYPTKSLAWTGLFLVLAAPLSRGQVLLSNGEENLVDAASDHIEVSDGPGGAGDPTTLLVVDGADIAASVDGVSVALFGSSILNMSGGQTAGSIEANDIADVTISGGVVPEDFEVFIGGNATASFTGGIVDVFAVGDNATATVDGGEVDDDMDAEGDAVLTVLDVFVNDDVDADDNGVMHLMGGVYDEDVTAAGNSTINISGGQYVQIFSEGAVLTATGGGAVHVTGGTFGVAGVDDGGSAVASLGGTLHFDGAQIAGVNDGTAPTATFSAILNGVAQVSNSEFGSLVLEAGSNGELHVDGVTADDISVSAFASGVINVDGGEAGSLELLAEVEQGTVNLAGGQFSVIEADLNNTGVLNIIGHSFTYNGVPVEMMDDLLGDENAFIEETGEIRAVTGDVGGVLADGSSFTLSFVREFAAGSAAQLFVKQIPEPSTLALAALSCCAALASLRPKHAKKSA